MYIYPRVSIPSSSPLVVKLRASLPLGQSRRAPSLVPTLPNTNWMTTIRTTTSRTTTSRQTVRKSTSMTASHMNSH